MQKLMGIVGEISDFRYEELPLYLEEFPANAFCPPTAPVPVADRRVSLFAEACELLKGRSAMADA